MRRLAALEATRGGLGYSAPAKALRGEVLGTDLSKSSAGAAEAHDVGLFGGVGAAGLRVPPQGAREAASARA